MPVKFELNKEAIVVNDEEHCDKFYDSINDYLFECEDEGITPTNEASNVYNVIMQFPNADKIINDVIDNIYANEETLPPDWDEIDIKNRFTNLDWFEEKLNELINEFNKKQTTHYYVEGDDKVKIKE